MINIFRSNAFFLNRALIGPREKIHYFFLVHYFRICDFLRTILKNDRFRREMKRILPVDAYSKDVSGFPFPPKYVSVYSFDLIENIQGTSFWCFEIYFGYFF